MRKKHCKGHEESIFLDFAKLQGKRIFLISFFGFVKVFFREEKGEKKEKSGSEEL